MLKYKNRQVVGKNKPEGSFEMRHEKRGDARKKEILDTAEQLFASNGFDNTSTNDIIKTIGIARGTLYHHFSSKEDILDAVIDRINENLVREAKKIAEDKNIPLLDRLTGSICALNVDSRIGEEVMIQVHKPQNALLHQKMQEKLISGIVPIITDLIEEGNKEGIFHSPYPKEAAEMAMIYSNAAFDELAEMSSNECMQKIQAFICHTERIMGAEEGTLQEPIMQIFLK